MANIQELFTKHFNGSIAVNKNIIQLYGTDAAVLLGELISKQKYWHERAGLNNGWFFWSRGDIFAATGLKRRQYGRVVKLLKEAGLIYIKHSPGRPNWFRVVTGKVEKAISNQVQNVPTTRYDMNRPPGTICTGTKPVTNPSTNPSSRDNKHKGKDTLEVADHYRKAFHDKHNQWPGRGIGSDRKDANVILKPLITEYGKDRVIKAIDNWLDDNWVHDQKPTLRHLSKKVLKYMQDGSGGNDYVPPEQWRFVDCPLCGKPCKDNPNTGEYTEHDCTG